MRDPFVFGYPSRQFVVRGRRFIQPLAVLTIGGAAVTDAQGRVYIVREDAQ